MIEKILFIDWLYFIYIEKTAILLDPFFVKCHYSYVFNDLISELCSTELYIWNKNHDNDNDKQYVYRMNALIC